MAGASAEPRFAGRVAVVTGASQGIGLAIARALAREGARVVLVARDESRLDQAVRSLGPQASSVAADIGDAGTPERVVATAVDRHGRLDILVNNAGLLVPGPIQQLDASGLAAMLRTNLAGPTMLTKAAAAAMSGAGAVLSISSAATKGPIVGAGVYGATKVAIEYLTTVWAAELAPQRIRVNALSVGATDTPQFRAVADQIPGYTESMLASQLVKRVADADEQIAPTALHLLDERTGGHITGAVFAVDGGFWPDVSVDVPSHPDA